MLAAIEEWGLAAALERFVGMFAFALWDRHERTLYLARDRIGEKPLYYGWSGGVFFFASELKALRRHPGFRADVDRGAVAAYLKFGNVPAPLSIYAGIKKLSPGTWCALTPSGAESGSEPEHHEYWSLYGAAARGLESPFAGDDAAAIAELDRLMKDSISMQMVADVPLGAFLSGGIDSSIVVAMMQSLSPAPVSTFTIGFEDREFNEAGHAKQVAAHLGTRHTELILDPRRAMQAIPELPGMYDEPFADVSQIPTYLVSEMTRRHVKVSLSGDGGDELFAGYSRHLAEAQKWGRLPYPVRKGAAGILGALPAEDWAKLIRGIGKISSGRFRLSHPAEKITKLKEWLKARDPVDRYYGATAYWPDSEAPLRARPAGAPWAERFRKHPGLDSVSGMVYLDTLLYLPDDVLVKTDRASMHVGLEGRVPMLDHRLIEFAWRLPMKMKIRDGKGKWILRQLLCRYLPKEMIDRPKQGFGVPLGAWLRGPLRTWAGELLDAKKLEREGFLDPGPIGHTWREHLDGRADWHRRLWSVLMFETWLAGNRASGS